MHSVENMGCSGMIFSWACIRTMQEFLVLWKAVGSNYNVVVVVVLLLLLIYHTEIPFERLVSK